MHSLRLSEHRGHANLGWLDSYHSFSFGHYHDPDHMCFGALRVINEDRVTPAPGLTRTAIATWRLSPGSSRARWNTRDSIGTGSIIRPANCSA